MIRTLFARQTLTTAVTWFRALSFTPVHYGRIPIEEFRGSNWQPPEAIQTEDRAAPSGIPDDWDKYNRVVYPPAAPGEPARTGVGISTLVSFVSVKRITASFR